MTLEEAKGLKVGDKVYFNSYVRDEVMGIFEYLDIDDEVIYCYWDGNDYTTNMDVKSCYTKTKKDMPNKRSLVEIINFALGTDLKEGEKFKFKDDANIFVCTVENNILKYTERNCNNWSYSSLPINILINKGIEIIRERKYNLKLTDKGAELFDYVLEINGHVDNVGTYMHMYLSKNRNIYTGYDKDNDLKWKDSDITPFYQDLIDKRYVEKIEVE